MDDLPTMKELEMGETSSETLTATEADIRLHLVHKVGLGLPIQMTTAISHSPLAHKGTF